MELYGSLFNISGSVTASAFTGSYIGDGAGLYNLPASGVTGLNLSQISSGGSVAAITSTGFTVNTNTQVQGNLSVTGALIANQYIVSSSVVYMTTSFASGSSAFGNDNSDVHQFTGSVQITGSISLNGQAIGTGKLDETVFQSYTSSNDARVLALETSSGSLNSFTSSINTTIKSKLDAEGVISGSVQVNITGTTGYSTFSSSMSSSIADVSSSIAITTSGLTNNITSLSSSVATTTSGLSSSVGSLSSSIATTTSDLSSSIGSLSSSVATTDLNQSNRLDSIEGKTGSYATTGSNLFKGTQTHSGSILPSVDNTYDLGSSTHQWRDVYISSGSLYIDGTKVISSTTQELQITTDNGQSIKILESGTDSIILQTADGDIELKSNADGDILLDPTNGKIMLKGPVEILNGQKIQSSVGGTPVVFANDIVVSGSIDITGTIEGINLTDFSSSANTRLVNLESNAGSLNSYTSSNTTNINAIHTATSSLNTFTSSINTTIKSKLDAEGVISGSVQVVLTGTTGYSTFSSSVSTSVGSLSSSIATTTSDLSSSIGSLSSSVATTTSGLTSTITSLSSSVSSSIGSLSSSVATTTSGISSTVSSLSSSVATTTSGLSSTISSLSSSVATTTSDIQGRTTSLEGKTGSYATTGSNIFQGDQTITGSLYVSQNLIIAGSSSIQNISSSVLNIADNIITVNALNPSVRFGGLAVIDSGSSPQVSGSMLFDSVNNQWLFVHQNQGTVTSSVLLMGPETYNDLGNETYITTNRLVKSTGIEHLADSNITDTGTKVSINSNTEITGTLKVTGEITSQYSSGDEGGQINLATPQTNTTLVGGIAIDVYQNRVRIFEQGGTNRGGFYNISAFSSGVGTNLLGTAETASYVEYTNVANKPALVSGSSQISFNGITDKPTLVSGSSQISFNSITDKPALVSGSSQITYGSLSGIPSGIVSGSSQVSYTGLSNIPTGIVSGSSQITYGSLSGIPSGIVSGSSQVSYTGLSNIPSGIVSGSSQITYGSLSGIPSGIVSGSSQITFGSISSIPGGLVSGSSQIDLTATTNYSTGIKTRLNAETVLSGSAQVVAALPSGTVSGSAQITLSSTTGYGSVLNQAVLTTSTPTFAELTITSNQDGKLTLRVPSSGDTNDWNYINFVGANGTRDMYFGTDSSGNPTWYRDDNGVNISLGSVATVNGTQIVTNSGTWGISITGNANTATTATTAGALSSMNISQFTNNSGYITGISFANVSSKPTTLSGYGITDALTNNNDSEQIIGLKEAYWNYGGNRVYTDPRWNESGYDADLGTLHIYSTTAAGASYGRAGIALYNGSAYQYLTTKASTTGLFANNSLILTAGNYTSYAMAGAGYSANQNLSTTSTVTFGNLRVGTGGSTNAGVLNVTGANDNQVNITHDSSWGLLLGYCNEGSSSGYHGPNHAAIINVRNATLHFGINNSSNVQISSGGHFHPSANNTYDCGTASLAWRNVYTNDLHLSNMNKPEGNDIDGTSGNWTIQEGAENLYIINNNNGKKFKISLEEII